MAVRIRNGVSSLKFIAERQKLSLQNRSMQQCCATAFWKFSSYRVTPCSQHVHNVLQQQYSKFSTSLKCTSNDHVNESIHSNAEGNMHQEILKCSSTKQVLDFVQSKGTVLPQHLHILLDRIVQLRYAELRKELPWLSTPIYRAHVQLALCFDSERVSTAITGHPTSTLLEKTLEGHLDTLTYEQISVVTSSLCFLGLNTVYPAYNERFNHICKRIENMCIKDVRGMAYPCRIQDSGDDFHSSKIMRRLHHLIENGEIKSPEDNIDFIRTVLPVTSRTDIELWTPLIEEQGKRALDVSLASLMLSDCDSQVTFWSFVYKRKTLLHAKLKPNLNFAL